MIIDTSKFTNPGGHQINEDSILCGNDLFIVADGLGGHYGGENASAAAVDYISERYNGDISDNAIEQLLEGANEAVSSLDDDSHTTLAAAFVSGERVRIANVGDSRVYIFRNNKILTVTKDHSVCQVAVDMGEMSYEEIRFSDDRSRLLKVLGDKDALNLKNKYEPIELYDGDAFLICSDGFWEYVHEREMEADLLKADSAESWKRLLLKRQLLRAKNEGDNYSLICGIVHSERKLAFTPLPATVAVRNTERLPEIEIKEQPPAKSGNNSLVIVLILLLLTLAAVVFWFIGGIKLFSNGSGSSSNETTDISVSETAETVTPETAEPVIPDTAETVISETTDTSAAESTEQSTAASDEATAESKEQYPPSTEDAPDEGTAPPPPPENAPDEGAAPPPPSENAPDETSEPPIATTVATTTVPTPTETEEPSPEEAETLPPTPDDNSPTESDPFVPIQTEMPPTPDDLLEPALTGGSSL